MSCPHCDGDNLEVLDELYQEHHHIEIYQCEDCGCVFRWESVRTVEHTPDEEDKSNPRPLMPLPLPVHVQIQNPRILDDDEDEEDEEDDGG